MDIFPNIEQVPPLPHEKVLRLAVTRMKAGYKPGWLYHKCKEQGLLDILMIFSPILILMMILPQPI
jgi:hypothetical protein